jgi:hypothetical protein
MAYVAISNALLSSVQDRINSMYRTEFNSVVQAGLALDDTDIDLVERTVWGDHLHLKDTLPDKWVRKCKRVDVQFRAPEYNQEFRCELTRHFKVPPYGGNNVEGARVVGSGDSNMVSYTEVNANLFSGEKFDAVRHTLANRGEITNRWAKVRTDVNQFLHECKSLNEALKLWPHIEVYIPAHYVEKLNEKREVSKSASRAAEILKDIDTSAAVVSATLARMAGATSTT